MPNPKLEAFLSTKVPSTANEQKMVQVTAPYNFADLPPFVLEAPVANDASTAADRYPSPARPHPEGLSGELSITISSDGSPLLVGGRENAHFFTTSGEPPTANKLNDLAIPGATVRGMVRSTLETVTAARFAITDLSNSHYDRDTRNERWKGIVQANGDPNSFQAAWLIPPSGNIAKNPIASEGWRVIIGTATKISFDEILNRFSQLTLHDLRNLTARQKYQKLGELDDTISLEGGGLYLANNQRPPNNSGRGSKNSELYFEFKDRHEQPVTMEDLGKFFSTHRVSSAEGSSEGSSLDFWWSALRDKKIDGIPCLRFSTTGNGGTRQYFSTSRFAKVAMEHSVGELLQNYREGTLPQNQLDFVQSLFGWVPRNEGEAVGTVSRRTNAQSSRRGRVRFSMVRCVNGEEAGEILPTTREVLMGPRASYWPYYLRNSKAGASGEPLDYNNSKARPAGWKRYAVRSQTGPFPPPPLKEDGSVNDAVRTELNFLGERLPGQSIQFKGKVAFRNLLPSELGGLIWALTLGEFASSDQNPQPVPRYRHLIGRAKAQSYGRVRLSIDPTASSIKASRAELTISDERSDPYQTCLKAFQEHVRTAYNAAVVAAREKGDLDQTRWEEAEQFEAIPFVAELLAMADPSVGDSVVSALAFPSDLESANPSIDGYKSIRKQASTARRQMLPSYPSGSDD